MKLRHTSQPEPEVNLTSLIDVVLLLLVFFMVTTSFVRESELTIRLPEVADSGQIIVERGELEITVIANGSYFVNNRALIDNRSATLRAAISKLMPQPSRGDGHGRGRKTRFRRNQYRYGFFDRARRVVEVPPQSTASVTPEAYAPAAVYRRLLGISAPYWRIFVVAALSMAIYAVTDTGFAFLMNNLIKTLTPEELSPELQFVRNGYRWQLCFCL